MPKIRQALPVVADAASYICLAYPFGVAFYAASRYDKCDPGHHVFSSTWWVYVLVADIPLGVAALIWLSIRGALADGLGWYARALKIGPLGFFLAMSGITGIIVLYLKFSPPCAALGTTGGGIQDGGGVGRIEIAQPVGRA
jgi:hypothetical protein